MNRETIEKRIAESEETMEICKMCGNERGYNMARDRVNSLRKQLSERSEAIDTRPERTGKEKEELVGYCKFCGQSYMVYANETYTEDELNELATEKCTCGQAANRRWKNSVQEVYMQDVEMIFSKDEEMKDLFAMAGKMVIDGKISAISVKKSAEKTLNLKMKGSGLCIQTTEKKKTENVSYGDLLFPKDPPKKKRKKHGKSIMPAYGGCWLCRHLYDDDRPKVTEEHHIYFGPNRTKSEEYGFKTALCVFHHRTGPNAVHKNSLTCRILQQACQAEFEKTHTREEFVRIIGKSYL